MRRRTTTFVLAGALAMGGVSACSEADQDQVEQQVEDGADEVGDEVQQQVEEGAEEGGG